VERSTGESTVVESLSADRWKTVPKQECKGGGKGGSPGGGPFLGGGGETCLGNVRRPRLRGGKGGRGLLGGRA